MTAIIGFYNKGQNSFTIQSIEGSLRHLQDYNFFIQNVCRLHNSTALTDGSSVHQ